MNGSAKDEHRYDDMLALPHHVSATHPHMPLSDRAAQFSPFAALVGYDACIREARRLTDRRVELDESEKAALDERLNLMQAHPEEPVRITYFQPDARKDGGAYLTVSGSVKRLDEYTRTVVMADGTLIPIAEIYEIDGALFQRLERNREV
jgi:hypothetical protein